MNGYDTKVLKVVVLLEGRDAAGKGGTIKRVTQELNPRICRALALGTPTEPEKTQWCFPLYVAHLPATGEMVRFDRSWDNRAGVEHVMGFCSEPEYLEFLHSCPEFERMLVPAAIILIKYSPLAIDDRLPGSDTGVPETGASRRDQVGAASPPRTQFHPRGIHTRGEVSGD
jgi:polyphosphate kinase 2 (PPK2 family)